MSNENTIECLERLQEENDELLAEVKRLRKELAYNSKVYHEMCEEGIMAWNNAECRLAGEEEMFGEVD